MRTPTILSWLGLLLLISGCGGQALSASQPGYPPVIPEAAHDFTLETLNGEAVNLKALQGKWVVINFWATWCVPCVKEMPYLQRVAADGELVVLGINFNESPEVVARFVDEHQLTFPILLEPDSITLTLYQARSLPRTFVVSPEGDIVLRIIGEINPEQFDAWREQHISPLAQY